MNESVMFGLLYGLTMVGFLWEMHQCRKERERNADRLMAKSLPEFKSMQAPQRKKQPEPVKAPDEYTQV